MIHWFSLPLTDHNQLDNAIHTSICSRNLIVVMAEGNASHESTGVEVVLELYLFVDRVQRCIFLYVHACTHELDRLAVLPPHHFEVHVQLPSLPFLVPDRDVSAQNLRLARHQLPHQRLYHRLLVRLRQLQ